MNVCDEVVTCGLFHVICLDTLRLRFSDQLHDVFRALLRNCEYAAVGDGGVGAKEHC
jgi:hypothetical protein